MTNAEKLKEITEAYKKLDNSLDLEVSKPWIACLHVLSSGKVSVSAWLVEYKNTDCLDFEILPEGKIGEVTLAEYSQSDADEVRKMLENWLNSKAGENK